FGIKGFDGTKLKDIAKEANISNAVLNYHFDGKEDLWKQAVTQLGEKLVQRYQEIAGYFQDLEGIAALKAFTRQFVYFSAEYPEFHRIIFHEMCTRTERATWLVKEVLNPLHHFFVYFYSSNKNLDIEGYAAANLSSIIIGASNTFFIHAFQMEQMYGVNPFEKEQIEKHADMVMDLVFAKFNK
ncbi:MAG: TetR/AcrR family transcriptional regulator, partial [Saprospiraceae bacterium]